jgi:hypothetical protein
VSSHDFTQLQLRREELNVFVLGPGYGEAVVIDMPGPGWLVIDGVGRRGELPVHELLSAQLGTDTIEALLLTHPHLDHYRGMRELIDHPLLGPRIRRIGCVEALVDAPSDPPRHSFGVEIDSRMALTHAPGVLAELGKARAVLERIQTFWSVDDRRRLALVEGPLHIGSDAIQARVLAPTRADIEAFFRPEGRARRFRDHANQISAVLELRFGRGRYLFTGDLSDPSWASVAERELGLNKHDCLKVPHHGSERAQPPALLRARTKGSRTWALTPFNRGASLPTRSGLSRLLEHEPKLHLTAFPVAWQRSSPAPAQVTLDQLESAPVRLRSTTARPRGQLSRRRVDRELRQRDCYWLFSFNSNGELIRSERGPVATTVVRGSVVSAPRAPA